jgi:arylformamidase
MLRLLSYPLGAETPTWGTNPPPRVTPESLIARGGVANWFRIDTINHNGTHVDAPWHYNDRGPTITDLPLDQWVFTTPRILDIPKFDGEVITGADLEVRAAQIRGADLLLVRTGWAARFRKRDPARFGKQAPGFHSSAGRYLINAHPSVRAIGMDVPSASSPQHIEEGHEFHRIALGAHGGDRYILIVEDMRIDADLRDHDIARIFLVPLLLEKLDGAPVTILAEMKD